MKSTDPEWVAMSSPQRAEWIFAAVIAGHPKGCVFIPGAAKKLAEMLPDWLDILGTEEGRRKLKVAFNSVEVYCPHEPGRSKTWC